MALAHRFPSDPCPDRGGSEWPLPGGSRGAVSGDEVVYGITTGFGALSTTRVEPDEAAELQLNLLRSHAAGVGPPLPDELVRAMLALRARTLAQGYSGVRTEIVSRLIEMLDLDLLPVVPSQGSVGASGDLAPFAHLALPIVGEGFLKIDGQAVPAAEALKQRNLSPLRLRPKEGLSLLNGTEGMLSMAVLGLDRARRLARAAISAAASRSRPCWSARPFRPDIHALRPHPVRSICPTDRERDRGLGDRASHAEIFIMPFGWILPPVRPMARCGPRHFAHVESVVVGSWARSSTSDCVCRNRKVVSGGNFHGQPLAFVLDFMAIGVTELDRSPSAAPIGCSIRSTRLDCRPPGGSARRNSGY